MSTEFYGAEEVMAQAEKCVYCGFCESVCPTLPFGPHRGYGPRGRITLVRGLLRGEVKLSDDVISSLYSCLLCNACSTVCPARIRVGDVVREVRAMIWPEVLRHDAAVRPR